MKSFNQFLRDTLTGGILFLLPLVDDNLIDWLRQFADEENNDETFVRGFLGKMRAFINQ